MRGVVTLATALALPEDPGVFPFRDLVLFAAFAVVLGTLVLQGLTLRPLMSLLRLVGDDVVAHEAARARARAAEAALTALEGKVDSGAMALRAEYERRRSFAPSPAAQLEGEHEHRMLALRTERQTILALRQSGEIGDDVCRPKSPWRPTGAVTDDMTSLRPIDLRRIEGGHLAQGEPADAPRFLFATR